MFVVGTLLADIQVSKTATVAELKDAVEAVFSHMPQKGPAKISWSLFTYSLFFFGISFSGISFK